MSAEATQLDLLPKDIWIEQSGTTPLDHLPEDDDLPSPPPSRALAESIKRHGVLTPVVIVPVGIFPSTFDVVDGRRRVKAARAAGLESIPTLTLTGHGMTAHALAIHYHATRSTNPLSDLAAIQNLQIKLVEEGRLGADGIVSEIARATGLAVGTVKARLRLLSLAVGWIDALKAGRITLAVAEKLVRLPAERRQALWQVYAANGDKLTEADLKKEARVGASGIAEQFDWDQIDGVPSAASEPIPFDVLEGIRIALSERFVDWSMDESTGTFVVSVPSGNYRLKVVRE